MKKFMKGCLTIALIFLAIGIVLVVAGASARGSDVISQVVEKVTGGRAHLNFGHGQNWGFTVADDFFEKLNDSDVKYDINDSLTFDADYEIMKDDVEKYCPGTDIKKLDIQVGGCVFETKQSDDGRFYIKAEKAHKFQGYVKDNTLYIRESGGARDWSRIGSCVITLYVPKDFCFQEAEVEMGAGAMNLSHLYASDKVSLAIGAGKIEVEKVECGELEISVGAGQIELKHMELDQLNAEIGMGDFTAEGEILSKADVECSMGNVRLQVKGTEKDFNYEVECAMGNIDIDSNSYKGFSQRKSIENGASKEMSLECAMGNITVTFQKH